ncbi:MAG: HAMP domain-containing sensor histidine kinase [Proteobacteria bacterium]|nr:HAMP domain-containing sensor histidine kinase [Pseudomonadota bacterium]
MKLPFRSLVSRLVAVGLLQLVVVAGTAIAIFVLEGPHDPALPSDFLDRETRDQLEALVDKPAGLQAKLDELEAHRIDVTLYDGERQLLASNVQPSLAIPARPPHDRPPPGAPPRRDPGPPDGPPDGPPGGFLMAPHIMVIPYHPHGDRGLLVARGRPGAPPGLAGPILALVSGFVVLVIGALLVARWVLRPIDRLAKAARALGEGDLTARSRLDRQDEIGELGDRFDEMAERIAGLLASEKELLANVAHELRTPLSRIGVALDIAAEGDAEAARASLSEIAVDISELEQIVDDILGALRFALGKTELPLHRIETSPDGIARAAIDRLKSRHPERALVPAIADHLPAIDADPMMLRRVLDNLIENAHKYSPAQAALIELAVFTRGDLVVFEVRDRGLGIAADDLPRVFTAFFRGDRSRSRETGGVGLGLTLSRRIVEAHCGTIAIASAPGVGTTVTVEIPRNATEKPVTPVAPKVAP